MLTSPRILATDDFVQYWAAGRVVLQGANPYDPAALSQWQAASGRTSYEANAPTIAWNPPWILPFLMPLGAIPYPWARIVWFCLSLAGLVISVRVLWRTYGGEQDFEPLALALVLAFPPTLSALRVGQLGPLLLAVLMGLLLAGIRGRWAVAGACAALLTIKPQLFHMLIVALILWAITERSLSLVIGGAVALLSALGVAAAVDPGVLGQYLTAVTTYPPDAWATPTVGGLLRLLLGVDRFWLQFLPSVLGNLWLCWYWWRRRDSWSWVKQVPILTLVGLLTAPYLWSYDLVLLAVPLVPALARLLQGKSVRSFLVSGPGLSYIILVVAMFVQGQFVRNDFWSLWFVPAFVLWYWVAESRSVTPVGPASAEP